MSGIVLRVFRICGIAVWTRRCGRFAPVFPVWRGNGPLPFRNRRLCCGASAGYAAADRPTAFCRSCACPQHMGADACFAAGADLRGAVWASANEAKSAAVKDGRQFPRCAAARRRAGRPERSPIWRLARMRLKRRRCGRGVSPTRAKPVRIPKGKWCASGGASDEISGRYAFSRL